MRQERRSEVKKALLRGLWGKGAGQQEGRPSVPVDVPRDADTLPKKRCGAVKWQGVRLGEKRKFVAPEKGLREISGK